MSLILQKLCVKILDEYYGSIVAKVGEFLFISGSSPKSFIVAHTKLPEHKVWEALAVLAQHNLITWEEWKDGIPMYILHQDCILLILRYPRYVFMIREQYGEEAEMVIDVLLKQGKASASKIIIASCLKLQGSPNDPGSGKSNIDKHVSIKNQLLQLIKNEFLIRCPIPQDAESAIPVFSIKQEELYNLPLNLIDLKMIKSEIQCRMTETGESTSALVFNYPDKDVLWRVNFDKFHVHIRDTVVQNSIVRRIDPLAGECLGAILKVSYVTSDPWASSFSPVTFSAVRGYLKDMKHLDQYLKILEEETGGFVQRVGDAGGGEYAVSMAAAFTVLTRCIIENVVQERLGSKASRIFRLILEHKMMEQDQIGELSMIGKKESNLLIHQLLSDNFVLIHEVRKTISPTPTSKTIYLFHVDMNAVVRMVLEWCYKSLHNLTVQRERLNDKHRRLLEKRTRVILTVENLKQCKATQEQIDEVEETLSCQEKETIEQILMAKDHIFEMEMGLSDNIFLLQMYIYYKGS